MPRKPAPSTIALCLALAAAFTASAPRAASADSISGSVVYDKLELTTPESALRAFLSAYRDGDFVTAYWIFSVSTQNEWLKRLQEFRMGSLVKNFSFGDKSVTEDLFPPMTELDQSDYSFVFAHMMAAAKRRGMLPLDVEGLPADLSSKNVPSLGKRTQTTTGDIDIAVTLKNYTAPVVFRLQLSKSGRWRLLQIIPPGSDEKSIPFGLAEK